MIVVLGVTITWLQLAASVPAAYRVCTYVAPNPKACIPHVMTPAERDRWFRRADGAGAG